MWRGSPIVAWDDSMGLAWRVGPALRLDASPRCGGWDPPYASIASPRVAGGTPPYASMPAPVWRVGPALLYDAQVQLTRQGRIA